jgi:hypothetical protein
MNRTNYKANVAPVKRFNGIHTTLAKRARQPPDAIKSPWRDFKGDN